MILLIRFVLIVVIIYLIIRSFIRFFQDQPVEEHKRGQHRETKEKSKGVSKEIGEYVDYEEVD
jgi:hypothetical protein